MYASQYQLIHHAGVVGQAVRVAPLRSEGVELEVVLLAGVDLLALAADL